MWSYLSTRSSLWFHHFSSRRSSFVWSYPELISICLPFELVHSSVFVDEWNSQDEEVVRTFLLNNNEDKIANINAYCCCYRRDYLHFSTMRTSCLLVAFYLLSTCVINITARAIGEDSVDVMVNDPSTDEEYAWMADASRYRHRLEHSADFQALRWSLRKLNKDDLCEFCDVAIPLVGHIVRFERLSIPWLDPSSGGCQWNSLLRQSPPTGLQRIQEDRSKCLHRCRSRVQGKSFELMCYLIIGYRVILLMN